jgi:hypothetical protein
MDASRYRSVTAVFSLKSMRFQLECLGFVYTLNYWIICKVLCSFVEWTGNFLPFFYGEGILGRNPKVCRRLFSLTIERSGVNWCILFFGIVVVDVEWLKLRLVRWLLHACLTMGRWYVLWAWLLMPQWPTVFVVLYLVVMRIFGAGCILLFLSVKHVLLVLCYACSGGRAVDESLMLIDGSCLTEYKFYIFHPVVCW